MTHTSPPQRVIVFISHANPEDNFFAKWLASRLSLAGYEVWCDLEELKGGEDFWNDIQTTIRVKCIKFIFVGSQSSVKKSGTLNELAEASKVEGIEDFIIPIKIDEIRYKDFPIEIARLNIINFSENWADGLKLLLSKLDKDNVPHDNANATFWGHLTADNGSILKRDERYWTNWFDFTLPDHIFVYKSSSNARDFDFPCVEDKNLLITFSKPDCLGKSIPFHTFEKIKTQKFVDEYSYELSIVDAKIERPNHKVIDLLNQAIEQFFVRKGLERYPQSNKDIFYFPKSGPLDTKIGLKRYDRRSKQLVGRHRKDSWHYGLAASSFLYPCPAYFFSHHLIFTNADDVPLDKKRQHTLRRQKGMNFYNKDWRDLLLAAVLALKDDDEILRLPIGCDEFLELSIEPMMLVSPRGYKEPE